MGKLGRIVGRAFGRRSKRHLEESSSHHETPNDPEEFMQEEVEEVVELGDEEEEGEAAEEPQEQGIDEADQLFLSLTEGREMQAYYHLKDRLFLHTQVYESDLLRATGIDDDFETIWKAVGWEAIEPMDEEGSRLLTIQFLCTIQESDDGVVFRLFNQEHHVPWKELNIHLGFNRKCATEIDYAISGFDRNKFWEEISSKVEFRTFKPQNTQIQHPTLRLIHRWISMTFFPASKVRWVHVTELKLLYAIVHKIKIAPIKEIFHHWLDIIRKPYAVSCTSLVTGIANALGVLDGQDIDYISIPRPICNMQTLSQGHTLTTDGKKDELYFFFPGYANKIRLPNSDLYLYNCQGLTFDLKTAEEIRRENLTKRLARAEAGSSSQHPREWAPYHDYPGYVPDNTGEWEQFVQPPQPADAEWPEADSDEWERRRLDSPPPIQPRHNPELEALGTRIGELRIQTGEIRHSLDTFVQETLQW